jgi:hypothetical protein
MCENYFSPPFKIIYNKEGKRIKVCQKCYDNATIKISKNTCPVCKKLMKDDTEAQQEYCEKCGVWYNY